MLTTLPAVVFNSPMERGPIKWTSTANERGFCETSKHIGKGISARYIEKLEITEIGESRSWRTCYFCHRQMVDNYHDEKLREAKEKIAEQN